MGVPPKIAGDPVTLTDPWEIERRLTQALRRALKMLTASYSSMPRSNKGARSRTEPWNNRMPTVPPCTWWHTVED